MIVYHGTTRSSANLIRVHGFAPKRPSRRVWFASHRGYAQQRARAKAKRGKDQPVVLKCDLDVNGLRASLSGNRVINQNGIIAVKGPVPASVLCEEPGALKHVPLQIGVPTSPAAMATWLNEILNLKPHKGVSRHHPGVQRLLNWIGNRVDANPHGNISKQELLAVSRQWLPEFFEGVEVDFERLRTLPAHGTVASATSPDPERDDLAEEADDEEEILDCILSDKPARRVRGLKLLSERGGPDLFEWTMMFVGDADASVQVAALEAMRGSADAHVALVADLAADEDRRVRAAALDLLAVHEDEALVDGKRRWLWAGLTDPDPHVRMAMVKHLSRLEPADNRDIFETALYDPNPEIARIASRLTEGKGFGKAVW